MKNLSSLDKDTLLHLLKNPTASSEEEGQPIEGQPIEGPLTEGREREKEAASPPSPPQENEIVKEEIKNYGEFKNVQLSNSVSPPPAPPTGEAKTYGHNGQIKLTTNEYIGLVNDYGADTVTDYIDQLDSYIASHGNENKYKNHYATIRRWIVKGNKDNLAKEAEAAAKTKEAAKSKRNRFANFEGRKRDWAEIERREREHIINSLVETPDSGAGAV